MSLSALESWTISQIGYLYFCHERLAEAEALFQGLATVRPTEPYPWHALGLIARRKGQLPLATQYFQHVLKLDAGHGDARLALGESLLEQGLTAEARPILQPFADAPKDADDTTRRGRALYRRWFQ